MSQSLYDSKDIPDIRAMANPEFWGYSCVKSPLAQFLRRGLQTAQGSGHARYLLGL